jgi:hypothetical protein
VIPQTLGSVTTFTYFCWLFILRFLVISSVTLDEAGIRSPLFHPENLSPTLNFYPIYCRDVGSDLRAIGVPTLGWKKCV